MEKIKSTNEKYKSLLILTAVFFVNYFLVWIFFIRETENLLRGSLLYLGIQLAVFCVFLSYLFFSSKKIVNDVKKTAALSFIIVLSFLLFTVFLRFFKLDYIIPYCLCGLIGASVIENRTAFMANITILLCFFAAVALFCNLPLAHLFYILFAGILGSVFANFMTDPYMTRIRYVWMGLILGAVNAAFALVTYFMFDTVFEAEAFTLSLVTAFAAGPLAIMLLFFIVPLTERFFGQVTNFRLAELTNTNQPLLKRLFNEAPGTFNHCLTVSNYAQACASAIGANPFLARAVSYYHDIGKLKNPLLFIENQSGRNPHDELSPEASVLSLKKHVLYGYALAKENNLPEEVCRGILEHHGTMLIKFFYSKAKKLTDGDLPYDNYRYDGPKPASKISAILMICDACEAALRAANDKTRAREIVNSIVEERMQFEQFTSCDITMQEIEIVKSTITDTYLGYKHERIDYPTMKFGGEK